MQTNELLVQLVEPSATQQRIIAGLLTEIGVTNIVVTPSGDAALEQMRRQQPDLVISSLYLPDMTGTDLVHIMRGETQLADTPFILISSETRFRYLDPIRQSGAVAILPKPFDLNELRIAIDSTLEYLDPEKLELDIFSPEELRVLMVDDSPLARKHIRHVLESLGIEQIAEAQDGVEAMEQINNNYFDLVVTDYNMPHMDGKELVDHIRNHSNQPSVPVLMVTSEENENRLAAVQRAGVSAICDKPFDIKTVKDLVQKTLAAT